MQTSSHLSLYIVIMLTACGCSKFDWTASKHYEIRPTQPLNVSSYHQSSQAVLTRLDVPRTVTATHVIFDETQAVMATPPTASDDALIADGTVPDASPMQVPSVTPTDDIPAPGADAGVQAFSEDSASHDAQWPTTAHDALEEARPCVDLNHADRATLMTLPGVGGRRADDILLRRARHPFRHKRDITKIKGIGPKTFQRMKDKLCDP